MNFDAMYNGGGEGHKIWWKFTKGGVSKPSKMFALLYMAHRTFQQRESTWTQVGRHLVHLLQALVASLQSLHHLHLNLSELDGLHHLLEVVQLGIGLVQQRFQVVLLLQQQLCFPGRERVFRCPRSLKIRHKILRSIAK